MSRTRKSDRIRPLERALHRAGEADRRLRQAAAEELGIGITDLDTLLLLDEYGALAAGRIAEALAITTGAVTGLVDRLERAGWVVRARHEADRRQVLVELASARRAAIDAHRALRERLLDEALSGTGDDALSSSVTLIEAAAQRLIAGAGEISERVSHGGADDDGASQEGERAPIGSATRGRLRFVAGVPRLELRGARIRDLYRASFEGRKPQVRVAADGTVTLQYKGFSWFGSSGVAAQVTLTSSVPWTIEIRGGISELSADLRELEIEAIDITGGASSSELRLPRPRGTSQLRVTGGANHVVVRRPKGAAAQAIVRGGANSLAFDTQHLGSFGSTAHFATPDFESAADRWSIELTGGASDLSVTEE
jgi:DNA-binding MarR family transcriptional regulator